MIENLFFLIAISFMAFAIVYNNIDKNDDLILGIKNEIKAGNFWLIYVIFVYILLCGWIINDLIEVAFYGKQ